MPKRKYFSELRRRQQLRRIIEESSRVEEEEDERDPQVTNSVHEGDHIRDSQNTFSLVNSDSQKIISVERRDDQVSVEDDNDSNISQAQSSVPGNNNEVSDETMDSERLKNKLRCWATECDIRNIHLTKLLKILKPYHNELPKDARTLLHTPLSNTVQDMGPGQYVHFGLKEALTKLFLASVHMEESVEISVNIDGLPPFKSANKSLWPILISMCGCTTVSIVGVFYGTAKPDINLFLARFIEEYNFIHSNGIEFKNRTYYPSIKHLVCDAPAKSYVLCVKGHTGYHSCTKCHIEGVSKERTMCFPDLQLKACARTDDEYRNEQLDSDFQIGLSPLVNLHGFNFIQNVPLDYMHLICLGIMKKLISLWFRGNLKYRLNHAKATAISSYLEALAKYTPSEFARKSRAITVYKYWKATEFRQFLLFTGYVALEGVLDSSVFENFKSLMICIRIFCNHEEFYEDGDKIAKFFVKSFAIIYGTHKMSHNIHGLLHLKDDVAKHGSLENFSAFKFENFLHSLKKNLRKSHQPLEQIYNRYWERNQCSLPPTTIREGPIRNSQHTSGVLPSSDKRGDISQYSRAIVKGLKINIKSLRDTTFSLTNGEIIKVINIIADKNKTKVDFKKYSHCDVFKNPCASSSIGFFLLSNLSTDIFECDIKDIEFKYYLMPHKSHTQKFFAMRI